MGEVELQCRPKDRLSQPVGSSGAIQECLCWAEITRSLARCISWSLFVGRPGEDVQQTQFLGRAPGGCSQLTLPVAGWQVF